MTRQDCHRAVEIVRQASEQDRPAVLRAMLKLLHHSKPTINLRNFIKECERPQNGQRHAW